MGVGGVAWATFIAQGASSVLAAVTLKKRVDTIPETKDAKVFSCSMLGRISAIAVPSILQQSFISVGNLTIQGLVNSFGSAVIAGYSAAIKLNTFAIMSFTTLSNGLSSFTAQNMGAGNPDRVKKGFWAGMALAVCVAVPFTLAYTLLGKEVIGLFMQSQSVKAVEVGRTFLIITAPFYPIIVSKLIGDAVLRGSGRMFQFMIATFSDLVLRVVLSFVFAQRWQETGIWLSWPVGWLIATVISMAFYFSGIWKKPYGARR